MRLHEFQAKKLLARFGIPIPPGRVVATAAEAREAAWEIGGPVVVKAQILSGGRGKAGGVKTASNPAQAEYQAQSLLGTHLTTPQTGPQGKLVRRLLVEAWTRTAREFYTALTVDRKAEAVTVMASSGGGMEIETNAIRAESLIVKDTISPLTGLPPHQAAGLASGLGLTGEPMRRQAAAIFMNLATAFRDLDAWLIEINPLGLTVQGTLLALDAKIIIDDNALARHPDLRDLRDPEDFSPAEREAERHGFNYVKLDGTVGCLVNGAGLSMATMDMIKLSGGMPANFLDIGGGATEESIAAAFRILVSDPDVRSALIHIFGGIVRCDLVARSILKAVADAEVHVPLVVRIEGSNAAEGLKILRDSGLSLHLASTMEEAVELAVRLAGKAVRT